MTPVFLLFSPRSGSTLLQRMLATHPDIRTASEPWVLLPHLYAMHGSGVYAEYGHRMMSNALGDFVARLPDGWNTYRSEVRAFAGRLYEEAAGTSGAAYFLDKSPRYTLVLDELTATFPDARFIVLWRNPLSVVASVVETWGGGAWKLEAHKIDLYDGLLALADWYRASPDRAHSVRYEDLIAEPGPTLSSVFRFLDLPDHPAAAVDFADVRLLGERGDPTGVAAYDRVSSEPLTKWHATIHNPLRKLWCRRYLDLIGAERLDAMGYDLEDLIGQLEEAPMSMDGLVSDTILSARGLLRAFFEVPLLRRKVKLLPRVHRIHPHR